MKKEKGAEPIVHHIAIMGADSHRKELSLALAALAVNGVQVIVDQEINTPEPLEFVIKALDFDSLLVNLQKDDLKKPEPFWKSLPKYKKGKSK